MVVGSTPDSVAAAVVVAVGALGGRSLIHDGRSSCSCLQPTQYPTASHELTCGSLVEAMSWWAQKEPAPRTDFQFCAVAAAARKLHPAAANIVAKFDRYDLPPQAKKVTSDSVQ